MQRRLDVVDEMCRAGKASEVTMTHFRQADAQRETNLAEVRDLLEERGKRWRR